MSSITATLLSSMLVMLTDSPQEGADNDTMRLECLQSRYRRCIVVPSYRGDASLGHQFGLRGRYVLRGNDAAVNKIQLDAATRLSTKMIQNHELQLRLRDAWGHDEILRAGVAYIDDPVFPFFGVANHERLSRATLSDRRYSLELRSLAAHFSLQQTIWRDHSPSGKRAPNSKRRPNQVLRWFGGVRWAFDTIHADDDSALIVERPEDGGTQYRGSVLSGVSWDSRNNEWAPSRGGMHDVSVELARPWAGSSTTWTRANLSLRWYRPIGTPKLVFAQRLLVDVISGAPPIYTLGEFGGLSPVAGIGGRRSARGISRRRFVGPAKTVSSTELRFNAFTFAVARRSVGVGIKAFADMGTVIQRQERWLQHLRYAAGGGIYVIWDRFFVFRVDLGVSDEGPQWYVVSNHMF
ncbi:MAG: BamA/TamA family outer membrane protein [Nannocystaceae bacterium]